MTPDFPVWTQTFRTQAFRFRTTTGSTLHQFEALFATWLPRWRLALSLAGGPGRSLLP